MNPHTIVLVLAACAMAAIAVPGAYASYDYPFELKWGESGIGEPGHFLNPQYVSVDSNGSVYVTDLGNKRVQKFDAHGDFLTSWGASGSMPGQFQSPAGITVHNGSVYVVDRNLNRVQQFNLDGGFVGEWGSRGSEDGQFILPVGIDHDSNGTIYVVDTGNQRVQLFTPDGEYISQFGSSGTDRDKFLNPTGISVDGGEIYVTDPGNNAVKKFLIDGTFVGNYDSRTAGLVMGPTGVLGDGRGNMYVADYRNDRVIYLGDDGLAITSWGIGGTRNGDFMSPTDVTMGPDGHIYVTDTNGNRIQKFGSPSVKTESDAPKSDSEAEKAKSNPPKKPAPEPVRGHTGMQKPILQPPTPITGDIIKPVVQAPEDLVVEATGPLTKVAVGYATAQDESGIQSLTNNAPTRFTLGSSTIIWTAIDGSGNLAVVSQQITVQDTVPPTLTPLSNITMLAAHPTHNVITLDVPEASDALGVTSITSNAPEHFPIGTTIVTWTATDLMSNTVTATQYIRIVDQDPPVLHIPAPVIQEAVSVDKNIVRLGRANVTDNSHSAYVGNDAPEYFELGNTTVTWRAEDESGNYASATQLVQITDTTAPEFAPLNPMVSEAISAASNEIILPEPEITEVQNYTVSNNAPKKFPIGTTLVTWTAVDGYGNTETAIQNVTIVDTTAPALNATAPVTVEARGPSGTQVTLLQPESLDTTSVVTVSNNAPELFALGTTNVTWTASDRYGNNATFVQAVTVLDTVAPELVAPAAVFAEASSMDNNAITLGSPVATDIVGVSSVTNNAPAVYSLGTHTVTWFSSDESGNMATANQTVTIMDTQPPAITPPAEITEEAQGAQGQSILLSVPVTSDEVGVAYVGNNAPATFPFGTTVVTWTATDTSGNSATALQNVTVRDTSPPRIIAPQNVTFEAQSVSRNTVPIGSVQTSDSVGIASVTNNAPTLFPLGTTLVTWTATDESDNSVYAIQTITVQDTRAPVITAPAAITAEASSSNGTAILLGNATASDIDKVTVTNNAPELFALGTTQITWTATDTSGNFATAVQTVIVQDTTAPTIAAPSDIAAEAVGLRNAVDLGTARVYDVAGTASAINDAPVTFALGITTVTWTASDVAGNSATATQRVQIVDSTAPVIAAPANVTAEAQSSAGTVIPIGAATVSDIHETVITNNAPAVFGIGTTHVIWTATDSAGNNASAVQSVTVNDTAPPTIIPPANVTVESTGRTTKVNLGEASANDAITDAIISHNAPNEFPLGTVQVTWTATDSSGNLATAVQTVTVHDTTAPAVTAPADVTAQADSDSGVRVQLGNATVTDIYDVIISHNAPELFALGTTQVTWTATDSSGNLATAVQTVTVEDTVAPSINTPTAVTAEAESASGAAVSLQEPAAFDTTGILSITSDAPLVFALGQTAVTWTVTDNWGNAATTVQTVSIVDTLPPSITLPETSVFEITGTTTKTTLDAAAASDTVDGEVVVTNNAPETFGLDAVNVTWTATDSSGNTATAVQTIEPNACGKSLEYYSMTIGTNGDDLVRGTAQPDLIFLLRGDDVAFGERGDDCIFGGQGSDVIFGGEGDDTMYGDGDGDVLRGDSGSDDIHGSEGYDIIDGGDGIDSCDAVSEGSSDLVTRCE